MTIAKSHYLVTKNIRVKILFQPSKMRERLKYQHPSLPANLISKWYLQNLTGDCKQGYYALIRWHNIPLGKIYNIAQEVIHKRLVYIICCFCSSIYGIIKNFLCKMPNIILHVLLPVINHTLTFPQFSIFYSSRYFCARIIISQLFFHFCY